MSRLPPPLADFSRQVEALRAVVVLLGEDAVTPEEMATACDLANLLKTVERMEVGLHMAHMRGARSADLAAHVDTVNVGDILWK